MIRTVRLCVEVKAILTILVVCYVTGVAYGFSRKGDRDLSSADLKEVSARASQAVEAYYGQMWFRLWQGPMIMVLKYTAILGLLMFTFGTTAIQGAVVYNKQTSENAANQKPVVIDGYVESYGPSQPHKHFWG
ncbi:uncharacterized protein LOC134218318 isoform X2 [Armigeres subalbatus]|uniref:uncharacterized protein LOC134218318 isoform X2 n=1 Tax=Armigeres subalbatus TaxID=124917 RepID=UPI002ED3850F